MGSVRQNFAGDGAFYCGSGSVTTTDLAAGAEEDLTITDANVIAGDYVKAAFNKAAAEAAGEPVIMKAWCSASGTITITVANVHASTGLGVAAKTVGYLTFRL